MMTELMMVTYRELGIQRKIRSRTVLTSSDCQNYRVTERREDPKETDR